MISLSRASATRALARVCFLVILHSTGICVPQLLAQATPAQAGNVPTQIATGALVPPSAGNATASPAGAAQVASAIAKKPGARRIGLMLPANQMDGHGSPKDNETIRDAQAQLLTSPTLETVRLAANTPEQAIEEARVMNCDYVLGSTLTQQQADVAAQSQGKFGRFGKLVSLRNVQMATTAAQFVPGIQVGALMTNMVMGSLAQTEMLTASKPVKANSDVHLEYTLIDVRGGIVKLHDTETMRSKNDGDNVLTPILTSAAKKIVPATSD